MLFHHVFVLSVCFLQDLPDVQELIAEVNAEKYSLQAAAILGEDNFRPGSFQVSGLILNVHQTTYCFVFQTLMRPLKLLLSSK